MNFKSEKRLTFPNNQHTMSLREAFAAAKSVYNGRLTLFSGDNVKHFEESFAQYHRKKYAVAVNSGTSALHMAIAAAGITDGDEVIVPALTFVATATAVLYNGAVPVFVDVDINDGSIDLDSVKKSITSRTKAIIPVHLCGIPCEMDGLMNIAKDHGLKIIEDAAQAFGSKYRGSLVGTIGDMGCFSFYESKNLVTGEGGMLLTDNQDYYNHAAILSNIGKSAVSGKCERSSKLDMTIHFARLGYNYRITDFQAAIGIVQISRINGLLERRRRNAAVLSERLAVIDEFILPHIPTHKEPAYNCLLVKINNNREWVQRNWLYKALLSKGVPVFLPYSRLVNEQPLFSPNEGGFENARYLVENSILFDVGPHLREKDINKIGDAVEATLSQNRAVKALYAYVPSKENSPNISPLPKTFFAGSSQKDITPNNRVLLPHLGSYANGVNDPLCARTLVMGTKQQDMVCFIHVDHLGIYYDHVLKIREGIAQTIGIPWRNIFILFSHTHSAPDLLGLWSEIDGNYFTFLYQQILESVKEARAAVKPAALQVGVGDLSRYTRNFDPKVQSGGARLAMFRVLDDNSDTISTVINLAVHSPEKGEFACRERGVISAELPGYICRSIDGSLGGTTLFVNSVVGDSYPVLERTSKSLKSNGFSGPCIDFGNKILAKAKEVDWITVKDVHNLSVSAETFYLPCTDSDLIKKYIPRGFCRAVSGNSIKTEIARITIGDQIEIAAFPGEMFCSAGEYILNKMCRPYKFIFSLSNDIIGYIIPPERFEAGGVKEEESPGVGAWDTIKENYQKVDSYEK